MRIGWMILATLLLAPAEQISTAQRADEPVRDENWGVAFVPPLDYQVRQAEGAYVLGSNTLEGVILVLPLRTGELDQLRVEMQEEIVEQNGTHLRPVGEPTRVGDNGLTGDFEGTLAHERAQAQVISLISPFGIGVSVMVVTTPEAFRQAHREAARTLAGSVEFFEPPIAPAAREWKERLTGRRLSHFSRYSSGSGGGSTSRTQLDLCREGHFYDQRHSGASFDAGGGAGGYAFGDRRGAGEWDVVTRDGEAVLRLRYYDGDVAEYAVRWGDTIPGSSSRYTRLNGTDYLRTSAEECP